MINQNIPTKRGNIKDRLMAQGKGAVMDRIRKDDRKRTALLLKTGLIGAFIILAGDMLMGWGLKDESSSGIARQLSQYLTVSEGRMFWASVFGFTGVPLAAAGHWGIYRLMRPYSKKYSLMYAVGVLGFLAFGGAGVHASSVEAAFFYKYMAAADPAGALDFALKFASYFLLPMYAVLIAGWALMVYAHIRAVSGGLSPYPRWCRVFSMVTGSLIFSLAGLFGNTEIANALTVGAFSMGNIWSLAGHLIMLPKDGQNL